MIATLDVRGDILTPTGSYLSPYGGIGRYENLAVQSEDLGTTWTTTGATVTVDQENGPNGSSSTADEVDFGATATNNVRQVLPATLAATTVYTVSVWAKAASGTPSFRFVLSDTGAAQILSADQTPSTSAWQRSRLDSPPTMAKAVGHSRTQAIVLSVGAPSSSA